MALPTATSGIAETETPAKRTAVAAPAVATTNPSAIASGSNSLNHPSLPVGGGTLFVTMFRRRWSHSFLASLQSSCKSVFFPYSSAPIDFFRRSTVHSTPGSSLSWSHKAMRHLLAEYERIAWGENPRAPRIRNVREGGKGKQASAKAARKRKSTQGQESSVQRLSSIRRVLDAWCAAE